MSSGIDYEIGDRAVSPWLGEHGVITGFDNGCALITTDDGAQLSVPVLVLTREATEA